MYSLSQTVNRVIGRDFVKQAVRYKRNFARKDRVVDPGIQKRKNLVDDKEEFEQLNDYEFDMEADFMNVATTHKEYEQEQNLLQEREKYFIVKQKYFKAKMPNFLTWSDKEQIRYLYNTNPEEWTIEKLSEGFPAVPEVIAKIVRSTWTKKGENKIQNHDESVKQNWALFKEGKLNHLPPDVVDHLNKFTNRDLNFKDIEIPKEFKAKNTKSMVAPNVKIGSEFSEIITSYERLKNKDKNDASKFDTINNNKLQKAPKKDTYLLNNYNSKQFSKHTTLDNLQQQVQKRAQQGKISEDDKVMLNALEEEKESLEEKSAIHSKEAEVSEPIITMNNAVTNKYTTNTEISSSVKNSDEQYDYPNKIVIPKDKFKRGYTYKLNDCYYDDDGEFLYRVPGMYK